MTKDDLEMSVQALLDDVSAAVLRRGGPNGWISRSVRGLRCMAGGLWACVFVIMRQGLITRRARRVISQIG